MTARLPRPVLTPHRDRDPGRHARIELVRWLARLHATLTGGAIRMPVLMALDRLLPAGPLPPVHVRLAPNVSLTLDDGGALTRAALIAGGYEHREAETLAGALRPDGVFVDVGANVGLLSVLIGLHRPDATVWALEPVPATADALAHHVRDAGLSNVLPMRVAAGAAPGESLIATTADNAFAHRVDGPATLVDTRTTRCTTVPLDDMWRVADCPRVDAIKIDVEGAELDVLTGARDLLAAHHPLLVVEAPTGREVWAIAAELRPHGYRRWYPRGVLPYNACFRTTSR